MKTDDRQDYVRTRIYFSRKSFKNVTLRIMRVLFCRMGISDKINIGFI